MAAEVANRCDESDICLVAFKDTHTHFTQSMKYYPDMRFYMTVTDDVCLIGEIFPVVFSHK